MDAEDPKVVKKIEKSIEKELEKEGMRLIQKFKNSWDRRTCSFQNEGI
jgi:hypothetical protein